ncbi:AAA family ATPase [Kitasatospora sp. NPDC002227]|uniref:ATP-binding protein n=1 Tax=Kitasatospora sp. NPDC002227 TaxID=3154773 RepID=UPI003331118B
MAGEQDAVRSEDGTGRAEGAQHLHERDRELESARRSLARLCDEFAAGGTEIGEVLLLDAPAGHGKTSVLDELRRMAGLRKNCTFLTGRGGERQTNEPFHVLRQLLHPVLSSLTEGERAEVFGDWYSIVGPAIGLMPPSGEMESFLDPQGIRDGLTHVLTQLAPRRAPLVMVVDDLHWADLESLAWLATFAARTRYLPVLLVFAYRGAEIRDEALAFQQQIENQASRKHLLRPLSPDSVALVVRAELGGDAEDAFCRQVWAVTAGSPFDTQALLREVREQGLKPVEENAPKLHDLAAYAKGMDEKYWLQKLGIKPLLFAQAAALIGTDIRQSLAANIAGQAPAEADQSVRELRRHRVLTSGTGDRLDFVHPLIGTSIYQSMKPAAQRAMHGQAATVIENSGGSLLDASRHLLETHPEGDDAVVDKLRRAAVEHLAIGAPEAAYRCLERALIEPPDEDERADLLYEAGCAALLTRPLDTVSQLQLALEIEGGLSPERRVDATFRLAEVLAHAGELVKAAEICRAEADRTPVGPGRTRLRATQLMWHMWQRDEDDGPGRSDLLRELYYSLSDGEASARAVQALRAWDVTLRGQSAARALELVTEALLEGEELPPELRWCGTTWGFELPAIVGLTFTYTDQLAQAEKLFSDAIMDFTVAGWSGAHLGFGYFLMGLVRFRRGFLTEAEDFLRRGLRLSERIAPDIPLQWDAVGVLADTLLARGRTEEAWELAERYRFRPPFHPTAMVLPDAPSLYGKLQLAMGDHAGAIATFREVGAQLDQRGRRNTVWAPWASHLAVALYATGEVEEARRTAADAVARAREFGTASAIGTALRLQAAVWDGQHAVELLEEAVGVLSQSPVAYEVAYALVDLGAALRRSGRLEEAAEYLYQGMEMAQHCAAEGLVTRARSELAHSGMRPNRLRTLSKDALSKPEWAVAKLAAQGVPPQRIADQLGVDLGLVHRRLVSVHRKVGTGPDGLAAALGLTRPEPGDGSSDGSSDGS